ncbi:MAG: GNAT family N-acetyltransferase [Candidatus Hermodarchaeota archaeon]
MIYFHLAHERELLQIESIIKDAYQSISNVLSRPPGALNDTAEKINNAFRKDQLYGVYSENKELIGTFSLAPLKEDTIKLFHLAIKPQYQKQGIGFWTIREVIKMIQKNMPRITGIELEIYFKIPSLLRFYERFGFTVTGEKRIRDENILILTKKL